MCGTLLKLNLVTLQFYSKVRNTQILDARNLQVLPPTLRCTCYIIRSRKSCMYENLLCNGKKQEASDQRDTQSHMLDLVHCKKHDSFNHYNLV